MCSKSHCGLDDLADHHLWWPRHGTASSRLHPDLRSSASLASTIDRRRVRLTTKPGPLLRVIGVGPQPQQLRGCFALIEPEAGAFAADGLDIR